MLELEQNTDVQPENNTRQLQILAANVSNLY